MDKSYSPGDIETRIYARWEQSQQFASRGGGEPYCIMIPPPNVTGTLHMGHAFQDTIMDALTRYHRMLGRRTLWQVGTDHAGIATQMVVERQLNEAGTTRQALGRGKFVERVWAWKRQSGDTISRQLRRLGASVDWSRECFTMDEGLSGAVTEVFVRLCDEGLIYRGKRLVNWDPVLHTALSDLEVLSEEEQGHLWHFRYPLAEGEESLVVATTRPETMLGDTAVAVHPDDDRYTHLIGRQVRLPLADRLIPVIADDYVDPEFGSGCVKITPAHDFNDHAIGQRHGLELINILASDASLNDNVPESYRGLDRFVARDRVVADLEAAGLLEKVEAHSLMVPRGDRSQTIVEPYLTDQWYVKVEPLAAEAIRAVETGSIRFVPGNWAKTYFEWMRNIEDWCISRQLWWGHRIPAWYDSEGNIYVGRDEAEVRSRHNLDADAPLEQDQDVLDTWFSSALWPFSTLGWPERTPELDTFYPTNVLVTSFDIIFFWVARMIMMGLKFMDDVPFREVYIHGLIRDHDGQKMSKSKGNVLDPIDFIDGIDLAGLLEKRTTGLMQPQLKPVIETATRKQFPDGIAAFGTDALRFTFAALATTGRDVSFDLRRVEGYGKFCNKLWNASRYTLDHLQQLDEGDIQPGVGDRWIVSRLGQTLETVRRCFGDYRLDLAAQALYEFTWHEYCDWYVELSKVVLHGETSSAAQKRAARRTLGETLESLLRAIHPLIPFISEEIWLRIAPILGNDADSIMQQAYPDPADYPREVDIETEVAWLQLFVLGIRQIRGEMNISPGRSLRVLLQDASEHDQQYLRMHEDFLRRLARIDDIEVLAEGREAPAVATALHGSMKILVPLEGLINIDAERARLEKQTRQAIEARTASLNKLGNQQFVDNAPPAVVQKERDRLKKLEQRIGQIEAQLSRLRTE